MRLKFFILFLCGLLLVSFVSADQLISRTADSDTYKTASGFRTTYYPTEHNYLKDGEYHPYNLTINKSSYMSYNNELNTEGVPFKVYIKNNTNLAEAVRFEKDGYFFVYDLSGGKMQWAEQPGFPARTDTLGSGAPSNSQDSVLSVSGNSFKYTGAYYNTNVEYVATKNMLKETFVLSGLPSIKDYTYLEYTGNIKFNRSLKICANNQCYTPSGTQDDFSTSGIIEFKDGNNITVFYLKEPIITDSNGATTTGTYKVKGSDAQMQFSLRVPKAFLQTSTFPIYFDPTVTYNFSVTYQGINMWAYTGSNSTKDGTPPSNTPNGGLLLADVTTNANLDTSDNLVVSSLSVYKSGFLANASISINKSEITNISWLWEGKSTASGSTFIAGYIWNHSSLSWINCTPQYAPTTTDETKFCEVYNSDFVDNNNQTLMLFYQNSSVSNRISTDYVSVSITYNGLVVNSPTSNQENNLSTILNTSQAGYTNTVWYTWNGGITNYTLCTSSTNCQAAISFPRNNSYNLTVYANDSANAITTVEVRNVTVGNSFVNVAPIIYNLTGNFSQNFSKTSGFLSVNVTDDNDYVLNASLYINGTIVSTNFSPKLKENTTFNFTTTYGHHSWYVEAYDSDGISNVTPINLFKINSPPTATTIVMNKTAGIQVTDDLNCSLTGESDVDQEDTLRKYYQWYKNGTAMNFNNSNLSKGNLSADDRWYCEGWVSDGNYNSTKISTAEVIIASTSGLETPIIIAMNATTAMTGLLSNATNPTNNNSWVNFSVYFTDSNTDRWTAYFCTTATYENCISNTSGVLLCMSERNTSAKSLSCVYNLTGFSGSAVNTFYSYVVDNTSLHSASASSTFEVNYPPTIPVLVFPPINTFMRINYTELTWTSDAVNYSLYVNISTELQLVYNGSDTSFNFTSALDEKTYYWRVEARDEHDYGIFNVTLGNFTVDFTNPNARITSPSNNSAISSLSTTIAYNISDAHLNSCYFTLRDSLGNVHNYAENTSCTCAENGTRPVSVLNAGTYTFYLYGKDSAGNENVSQVTFTASSAGSSDSGAGGSTPKEEKQTCAETGNIWYIETSNKRDAYTFIVPYKSARPTSKGIILYNKGNNNVTVNLRCEQTSNTSINICDYVELMSTTVDLPPNEQEQVQVTMYVRYPPNATSNEKFSFNIIADDGVCVNKLSNAVYIFRFSLTKWGTVDLSVLQQNWGSFTYPTIVPAIIVWLMFIGLGIWIAKKSKSGFVGMFLIATLAGGAAFLTVMLV